jgi:hypothetical protein
MAVPGMTARYQNAIQPQAESFKNKQRIYPPGTGNPQDSNVGRVTNTGRSGKIGPRITAPAAENGQNPWLPTLLFLLRLYLRFHRFLNYRSGVRGTRIEAKTSSKRL